MSRNRLQSETSPYLLQHADNPVDWHPWGEAALALAREQDKPILLSIGYSACHWCHVMAHESFEDEEVAAVMNAHFVNIKVDREERPDLDKIYQLAYQLIARRGGGWPLTVFLNPHNHLPIYAGTYFPKTPRYQLPGFIGILEQVADHYQRDKSAIASNERAFTQAFAQISRDEPGSAPTVELIELARRHLAADFDAENGGFGGAPKFPHIASLEFLLNLWWLSGQRDDDVLNIVTTSLRKMAEGGLQDQIGGGFCRYSVDAQWEIPHFEKMLYDNGPLLGLYAEAYRATGDGYFHDVAEATATWAIRDMQSPEGGFYSSLDADSEGHEGKFYVWDRHEIRRLLPPQEYAVVERHYGLDQPANFEGRWHLKVALPLAETASALGIAEDDAACLLLSARAILYSARIHRIPPGLDDKLLTAWNGLMIKGLATAGRLLDREDFIDAAQRAFDFIVARCRDGERRLWATYKDGRAHLPAYLDDYAYLLDAGLELLQSRWSDTTLNRLIGWAETLLLAFEDRDSGGFFFTAADHEQLIHRPKSFSDESMASGNGIAALALARLGHLVGEARYLAAAARTLQAGGGSMRRYPSSHGALLMAALDELNPPEMIVICGSDPEELAVWRTCAEQRNPHGPRRLIHALTGGGDLPGLLKARGAVAGTTAYLCTGSECREPIRSLAEWTAMSGG